MLNPLHPQTKALRCHEVIREYGDDLLESNLIDLLADAMHWCNAYGYSFERSLRQARRHYKDER
jgi:hypothetical protein